MLAEFSERLADLDVAIYEIAYYFLAFGSWTLNVGKRHRRLLVQWDGKESLLTCSVADVSDSQATRDWKQVAEISLVGVDIPAGLFEATQELVIEHVGT